MRGRRSRRERIRSQFHDVRSRRVVLLSHCLLNQNTRYLGGAVCPGAVRGVIEPYLDAGVGLIQLPCPEQQTLGGVEKLALLWIIDHPMVSRIAAPLSGLGTAYLRRRYRRIAQKVVSEVADYVDGGFEITGIVGVAGSPSCGVDTTLDLATALRALGTRPCSPIDADWFDRAVIGAATIPGAGIFIAELTGELGRKGLTVPIEEVTLRSSPPVGELV